MAKKNSHMDKEELWSKRFDENSDYSDGTLSRSAKKKAERGIPPILTTTLIFLALLIIVPSSAYIWWSNDPDPVQNETAQAQEGVQVSKNSTSIQPQSSNKIEEETEEIKEEKMEEPVEKEAESQKKVTEETALEAETAPKTETALSETETQAVEEPSTEVVEEQPAAETTPVEEESSESGYSTYTVKSGDNLFRIALNHGMSTDELKQLNGITTDEVQVGAVLRVE